MRPICFLFPYSTAWTWGTRCDERRLPLPADRKRPLWQARLRIPNSDFSPFLTQSFGAEALAGGRHVKQLDHQLISEQKVDLGKLSYQITI